jgi:microsomal dipeptidase-like Zn-dependent dipeptidase
MRAALLLAPVLAGVVLATACSSASAPTPPPPCAAISPLPIDGVPDGVVWGFADLHAHPAIEVAFGHRLIWGTALDDVTPDATQLPRILPCPVETHDPEATSPLEREVGAQVFPPLSSLGGFAHGPVGVAGSTAWPNARDVIHQQMNVASIRRAYEGGLRLMFAATTDNQAFAALLAGPNVVNGFGPDPEADYRSARLQLDLIEQMVRQNSTWMAIAKTPEEARTEIAHGKLALVLSLEMDGLRPTDIDRLVADYGVRHILPIHLVDNDVGGTAANGDLFNAASAAVSAIYRCDGKSERYMDVAAATDANRAMGWPVRIGTLPVPLYATLTPVDYAAYKDMCYEPLASCAGPTATPSSFIEFGQENLRGLCRTKTECLTPGYHYGADRIAALMNEHLFIDVSHMSKRSVADTLKIDPSYPLMASHGDVTHLCDGDATCRESQPSPMTERALDGTYARAILANQGVLGLGTGVGGYLARDVLASRGGPLFTLTASHAASCVATSQDCAPIVAPKDAALDLPLDTLVVTTNGGVPANVTFAQPVVRVVMRAHVADWQYQKHVFVAPMDCSTGGCSASIVLGTRDELVSPAEVPEAACATPTCGGSIPCGASSYTVDDVESVTLEWQYLGCASGDCPSKSLVANQCQTSWDDDAAPIWTINEAAVRARVGSDLRSEAILAHLTRGDGAPVARVGHKRGSLVVYKRDDRRDTRQAIAVPASGHLLRISVRAAPGNVLGGATPAQLGGQVCVAVRQTTNDGTCAPNTMPPLPAGAACPPGWVSLNQRGEWTGDDNVVLYTFARIQGDETSVCGVDLAVLDWPQTTASFDVDEVRIEAIEDPVSHWFHRYAAIDRLAGDERLGSIAFGSDFNGLNGMLDISEGGLPQGAMAASECGVVGGGSGLRPLAPMRIRNPDGSLGYEVKIDDRGLATYGLLADMVAIIRANPDPCAADVYDSLMLSAEATIRMWEKMNGEPSRPPLPKAAHHFECTSQ